jgi:Actinobacteria/chloroflexi VLRF1 release factor
MCPSSSRGAERYELPPARLARWLDRWAATHAPVTSTEVGADEVVFVGAERVACEPPFEPLPAEVRGARAGFDPEPLLDHVRRERTVGVLLVRLGGHAAGVFEGDRLVDSKVGSRLVHGRHRKGGSSSGRFARRREGQARAALEQAADVAARVLLARARPLAGKDGAAVRPLDAVILGGDRRALDAVLADPRLEPLRALATGRILDVPDPRLDVLRSMPDRFLATIVRPSGRISE